MRTSGSGATVSLTLGFMLAGMRPPTREPSKSLVTGLSSCFPPRWVSVSWPPR